MPDIEVITGGEHQSSALGAMFRRVGSGVGQPLNVDGTNANNVRLYGLPQDTDSLTPTNL